VKKTWKKVLAVVLATLMVVGLVPMTVFAAVDSTGRPKDVNNTLVLSIYTGSGFPGEPAVYGTGNYKNFNSKFEVKSGATFANSAKNQLDWNKIQKDIVQGTTSGSTSVWGVYDANGTKDYFLTDATIIAPENEAKMIRAIKTDMKNKSDDEVLAKYEIVWYVIKLQHNSGSWWSSGTTEWHIDGVIKERENISINYYGNGNTSGAAPLGTAAHTAGDPYTVLGKNTMVKKIGGVEVAFLGWSAKADGTGEEAGFYQPGDVINPTHSISLYAMWDTTTQYTATVNTYLDGKLTSDSTIHGKNRSLYLSTDNEHFYELVEGDAGVYTAKITGNGKFHLYHKNEAGVYIQVGSYQLTIYNQDASLDILHYSVAYDANGGSFDGGAIKDVYFYGEAVNVISSVPVRDGYSFIGWKYGDSNIFKAGDKVTSSISEAMTLTAQWIKNINVTVNVTINHVGGDGYDQMETKNDVFMALVSRADSNSAYLETGDVLDLSEDAHLGFDYSEINNVSKYTSQGFTFTNMPGGTTGYSVATSKSGYDTTVETRQDADGNWIIDVVMTYAPTNFDLDFTVKVDESVPYKYIPNAVIVKVTFWSTDRNCWEIITQQEGGKPGVRVDIDPATRSGFGSYPVWKYESSGNSPYAYRIQVTAFVYADGTIVPASNVMVQNVKWTDNVYVATMDEVVYGQKIDTLNGAYFDDASNAQIGTLNAVVTVDLYDVIFDAQGGTVNGTNSQIVTEQHNVPKFNEFIPVRDGGYIFDGWYKNVACTIPAIEGEDLSENITLYAKWIEPLTVSGSVDVKGTYIQNGETIKVNGIDRANEVVIILQEIRNGKYYEVDSVNISLTYNVDGNASAEYSFTGIPNDGREYRIYVLELNYGAKYDNESDNGTSYSENEYTAEFSGDTVADVDVLMDFVPQVYDQELIVDATQIGAEKRPSSVLSEVIYRDMGDNHAFNTITQHTQLPYGVIIILENGMGSGVQSVWKWHTNGTLYAYQMNITKVDSEKFDSDDAPFYIVYSEPAHWDNATGTYSNKLKATLIPKNYKVTFDLNAGEDIIVGMDTFKQEDDSYAATHTWSFDTVLNAVPEREGYVFVGWKLGEKTYTSDVTIDADVHEDIVLVAQWEKEIISNVVVTISDPREGGTTVGDGTYTLGDNVLVVATPNEHYSFDGWYENGVLVSNSMTYSFTISSDRSLTAKFTKNTYTIGANAIPEKGGTISGCGSYLAGTEITLVATPSAGYTFVAWLDENGETISTNKTLKHVVLGDRQFKAHFNMVSEYTNSYAYILGYTDTEMGAEGPLLRCEVAVMVHRLVKQNNERGDFVYNSMNPSFTDISGEWFQSGIEYIHYRGGFTAQEGTAVYPYAQVTRGEVFKIVALGLHFTDDATLSYAEYGQILADRGYIIGVAGSGDLACGNYMTRAEFCTMFNRIIGRENALLIDANGNKITAETYGFTDLDPNAWYYEAVLRATSAYDENGYVDVSKRAIRDVVDDYS